MIFDQTNHFSQSPIGDATESFVPVDSEPTVRQVVVVIAFDALVVSPLSGQPQHLGVGYRVRLRENRGESGSTATGVRIDVGVV